MDTPASHLERIARDGYTILERVIEPELIYLQRVKEGFDVRSARNPFKGAHTVRICNLLVHGKLYEQIPVHERVLPIVEGVLDPGCLVSSLSSISIDPGERASAHAEDVQNLRHDELVPEGRQAGSCRPASRSWTGPARGQGPHAGQRAGRLNRLSESVTDSVGLPEIPSASLVDLGLTPLFSRSASLLGTHPPVWVGDGFGHFRP